MDSTTQLQRPQRPKLPSFAAYESSAPPAQPGLYHSCHALQSVLQGPTHTLQVPPLGSPMISPGPRQTSSARHHSQPSQRPAAPPRLSTKRSRDDSDDGDDMMMEWDEPQPQVSEHDGYQTPKRRRTLSVDLPLGLSTSDFNSLPTPSLPQDVDVDRMDEDYPSYGNHNDTSFAQAQAFPNTQDPNTTHLQRPPSTANTQFFGANFEGLSFSTHAQTSHVQIQPEMSRQQLFVS